MTKRIVAVTGEYTKDGQQKAEFTEVGVIVTGSNGKDYVLLNPEISIAGVMAKQNALAMKKGEPIRDNVMCSLFDNDNQQGQQNQTQGYQQPQQGYQQQQYQQAPQQGYQQPPQQQGYRR